MTNNTPVPCVPFFLQSAPLKTSQCMLNFWQITRNHSIPWRCCFISLGVSTAGWWYSNVWLTGSHQHQTVWWFFYFFLFFSLVLKLKQARFRNKAQTNLDPWFSDVIKFIYQLAVQFLNSYTTGYAAACLKMPSCWPS